jgi:hypothetical protein
MFNLCLLLNVGSLTTQPSATPCPGQMRFSAQQISSISSTKPCSSQCTNILSDCCLFQLNFLGYILRNTLLSRVYYTISLILDLLLLHTHRPVNIAGNIQFQPNSILASITFNFGIPIYISDGVTFELNGYSFLLNGNFMLGVSSVYVFISFCSEYQNGKVKYFWICIRSGSK